MFRPGDWYGQLRKPAWRPPNWAFPPAWTFLYLTIAVSGWLVWRTSGFAGAAFPFAIYLVQLILNASWSPIFFWNAPSRLGLYRSRYAVVVDHRDHCGFPPRKC